MPPIKTLDLSRQFNQVMALNRISLEIKEQELFALLGPDGAGKTTLCRILSGIMDPSSGQAWIADLEIQKNAEKIKNFIGYMPQSFALYPDLTVEENINFYADLYGVPIPERKARMERLMEITNLSPFTKRYAGNLSGGMKQKLTLSACLIHTPKILILDEPTLGVDPVSRREFWKLLYDLLKDGVTILVATSYMEEAERCNRLAVLNHGHIIACDTPEGIKKMVPGEILEIETSNLNTALKTAAKLPQVMLATTFGNNLRLLIEEKPEVANSVLTQLSSQGWEITNHRILSPSIEDAFIYLVNQKNDD